MRKVRASQAMSAAKGIYEHKEDEQRHNMFKDIHGRTVPGVGSYQLRVKGRVRHTGIPRTLFE